MTDRARACVTIAALCLIAAPVRAEEAHLCPLVADLGQFIAGHSALEPLPDCPAVSLDLPEMPSGAARSQAGAFDPATGRIALAPDLDMGDPVGRSFLLHELVHAAQFRAGLDRQVRCPAELEAQAYLIQSEYLRTHGRSREALMTMVLAGQLGRCGVGSDSDG